MSGHFRPAPSGNAPLALITGGNTGIGFETCKGLLKAGFHVVICARSQAKADDAVMRLLQGAPAGATAEALVVDLASLQSVRDAAKRFLAAARPLHVCILNAGIMAQPWQQTIDGFEQQWQVNVLGHFLLSRLLLPALDAASEPCGRIVHVAAGAHRLHPADIDYSRLEKEHHSAEAYDQWEAYGRSKLANILLSDELARRLQAMGSRVTSNALHPGNVNTNLWWKVGQHNNAGISPQQGALTSLYLACSNELNGRSGGYYFKRKPVTTIYDAEIHRNRSSLFKSATRTSISTSTQAAAAAWNQASNDLGLSEDLRAPATMSRTAAAPGRRDAGGAAQLNIARA